MDEMKTVGTFVLPKDDEGEKEIAVSWRLIVPKKVIGVRIAQRGNTVNLTGYAETGGTITKQILLSAVANAFNYEGRPEKVPHDYLVKRSTIEELIVYYAYKVPPTDPLELPGGMPKDRGEPKYEFSPQ